MRVSMKLVVTATPFVPADGRFEAESHGGQVFVNAAGLRH